MIIVEGKNLWTRIKSYTENDILYCNEYIKNPRIRCYYDPDKTELVGNNCHFALSYNLADEGVDCEILDKRINSSKPECCECDFYKKLLELV